MVKCISIVCSDSQAPVIFTRPRQWTAFRDVILWRKVEAQAWVALPQAVSGSPASELVLLVVEVLHCRLPIRLWTCSDMCPWERRGKKWAPNRHVDGAFLSTPGSYIASPKQLCGMLTRPVLTLAVALIWEESHAVRMSRHAGVYRALCMSPWFWLSVPLGETIYLSKGRL